MRGGDEDPVAGSRRERDRATEAQRPLSGRARHLWLAVAALSVAAAFSVLKLWYHCRLPASEACVWGKAYFVIGFPLETIIVGAVLFALLVVTKAAKGLWAVAVMVAGSAAPACDGPRGDVSDEARARVEGAASLPALLPSGQTLGAPEPFRKKEER